MEFNFEKEILCVCGTIFETADFKKHFTECPKFKEAFGDFDGQLRFLTFFSTFSSKIFILKIIKIFSFLFIISNIGAYFRSS